MSAYEEGAEEEKMIDSKFRGNVYIVQGDEVLYERVSGFADFEYSDAIVHLFRKFRALFSGKVVHTFPERSAVI